MARKNERDKVIENISIVQAKLGSNLQNLERKKQ